MITLTIWSLMILINCAPTQRPTVHIMWFLLFTVWMNQQPPNSQQNLNPPQRGITSAYVQEYMLQEEEVEECLNSILNHVHVCTNTCTCCCHNIHYWVDQGEFMQTVQLPYWNDSTLVHVQPETQSTCCSTRTSIMQRC